jgi:hypothetical protein
VSPWRLWRRSVGCRRLRKDFDCRFSNFCGTSVDGRIRWGTQMRPTGELMLPLLATLFAASDGGERRSSSLPTQTLSRQVGTARSSIGVATGEI